MAARYDDIYAVVDVGSSKVSALIAGRGETGELSVLGTGQRESHGVKRGYVVDVDACEIGIRNAVEQAERVAGLNIEQAWVGFSAGGLMSHVGVLETDLGGHRVEQEDIDELLTQSRDSIDPEGRLIIHAQPALYTIDGLTGVTHPIGLHADRLGVHLHVVLAEPSPVRNIEMAVNRAHLGVQAVVANPMASGLACLSQEERELGVALIEIGAAVTNISIWLRGVLIGIHSIPWGAGDVTDDIASAFGIRRAQAERLKCFYGSAQSSPKDNHEMIELEKDASAAPEDEARRISRAQLIAVIRQRLDHLTGEIKQALSDLGFLGPSGRQLVLTGGGAELKGVADYMQSAMGRTVRTGSPRGLSALPEAHAGPAFSGLVGLALHVAENPVDVRQIYWEGAARKARDGHQSGWRRLFAIMKEAF